MAAMVTERDIARAAVEHRRSTLCDYASECAAGHEGYRNCAPLVVSVLAPSEDADAALRLFWRLVDAINLFHEYVSSPESERRILLDCGIAATDETRSAYHEVLAERVEHLLDSLCLRAEMER